MKPIESTSEILAFKVLNRNIDSSWFEWANDMLNEGFSNKYLLILASETEETNQFQLQDLADRTLKELKLDFSDKEAIIKKYVTFLIQRFQKGKAETLDILKIITDIFFELERPSFLYDFYALFDAKDDLMDHGVTWMWEGATVENIDSIILEYCNNWIENNK